MAAADAKAPAAGDFNYRRLLWKYMNNVGQSEGVTFLSDQFRNALDGTSCALTDAEWAELKRLDALKDPP